MRRKLYQAGMLGVMLTFGIIVMSCGTTQLGSYSPSLQPTDQEQVCYLKIDRRMGITGINGKPVQWGIARQTKHTKITIPAGLNTLRFEYHSQGNAEETTYTAWNYVFTHDFVPGHNYQISASVFGFRTLTVRVFVNDLTDRKLSQTITLN